MSGRRRYQNMKTWISQQTMVKSYPNFRPKLKGQKLESTEVSVLVKFKPNLGEANWSLQSLQMEKSTNGKQNRIEDYFKIYTFLVWVCSAQLVFIMFPMNYVLWIMFFQILSSLAHLLSIKTLFHNCSILWSSRSNLSRMQGLESPFTTVFTS